MVPSEDRSSGCPRERDLQCDTAMQLIRKKKTIQQSLKTIYLEMSQKYFSDSN